MQTRPSFSGTAVVLVGHFNPLIFRPGWFSKVRILSEEDAAFANQNMEIVHRDIVVFATEWLQFSVDKEKLTAASSDDPKIRIFDFIMGTFTRLRDTPVRAFGINYDFHFPMGSEEKWHDLGDELAPKGRWGDFLVSEDGRRKGGLRTLVMEQPRDPPGSGYIQVKVEPSLKVKNGVYIQINEHYQMRLHADDGEEPVPAGTAMDIFSDAWGQCEERVSPICDYVLKT